MNLQREGFFTAGEQIAIDRSHPRFAATGEPLFDEAQPSAQLRQVQRLLGQLQAGIERSHAFIRTLRELEPIEVSMNFDDGERLTLQGLYTVSMDSLHALGDAQALRLFRQGDLPRIYLMNASLNQIAVLAARRNRQLIGSA
ncbi:MAG: SapC family protein [Pseudomonadota bacterium]|nr:SapC family protein [Pseudomonadota bacterium]